MSESVSYQLDPAGARSAGISPRIQVSGRYVGKFTRAEAIKSTEGTQGIEFTFETDEGASADFLTLWTRNRDGKDLFGRKVLDALLTCMKVKTMTSKAATIEKWVDGSKQQVATQVFTELMGKPIGLVLQLAPYERPDGAVVPKMDIYSSFCATGEDKDKTAVEILDRKPATALVGILANLTDRPARRRTPAPPASTGPVAGVGPSISHADAMAALDSDIPFISCSMAYDMESRVARRLRRRAR